MSILRFSSTGRILRDFPRSEGRPSWALVIATVGLFLVVDLLVSVLWGTAQLRHAGDLLDDAMSSLGDDEVASAEAELDAAGVKLRSSADLLGHPGVAIAGILPVLGDELEALRALVAAAGRGVDAAREVTQELVAAGARERGVTGVVYRAGTFDLDAIELLGNAAERSIRHLDSAAEYLAAVAGKPALGPLERALERAQDRVAGALDAARRAIDAAALLPGMTGADRPRRYFLAFQSPSEARGGGGVIGVFGILSARNGRLSLNEVAPIEELGPTVRRPVEAPPTFEALYGPLSSLDDWRQANASPTFPLTSQVLVRLFERSRGQRLDGVVAMDPITLGQFSRGLPGLKADGWDKTITNSNARRLLLFKIYKHFVHQERLQNAYLRALIDELWARIARGEVEPGGLLRGAFEAASTQHLKLFSVAAEEQRLLESLGIAADPRTVDAPLQAIFHNNNSGNKLDFFLHRTQSTDVVLGSGGDAEVSTTIELFNDPPRRGLRAMSRSGVSSGLSRGENRMSVHFMLPRRARLESFDIDGVARKPFRGRDGGFPVAWRSLTIGPNDTATVAVSYRIEDALDDGGRMFRFTLWPQTTARPDSFRLTITAPPGRSFETRAGVLREVIELSGRLREPESIALRLSAAA